MTSCFGKNDRQNKTPTATDRPFDTKTKAIIVIRHHDNLLISHYLFIMNESLRWMNDEWM
jgi:hypothetical protein